MKHLGIAFSLAFAASASLFCILALAFGMDVHAAAGVAGLPFIASPHLCELLERKEGRKQLASAATASVPKAVYAFEGFVLDWRLMILFGAIVVVGVTQLSGVLGLVIAGLLQVSSIATVNEKAALAVGLPINFVAIYFMGRWIGGRCSRFGLPTVLLAVFLGILGAKAIDFAAVPSDEFAAMFGVDKSSEMFLIHIFGGSIIYLIPGSIGYWRGRQTRLARYLRYLLGILPRDTRDALVSLAYEEMHSLAVRKERPAPAAVVAAA